ncbi:ion channel [Natrinema sp. 1APR25-10V2]|uniref:ion channel n=1 Tax=Natrinema sp. 1APR25-10V2 TaxID=2951081 RepID=UPI0028758170|nr:ion channel [Natrinema sp. 1APR25-10V2]MDS0475580.1 ion channel [Natrinema sp. 1APR25-10V2]
MLEALHPRRPSGRAAVWIVTAIALASIGTGIGAIVTQPALETGGALGDLQAAAEFSGTIVGFALLVTAWGMRRDYRLAYAVAVALVFLAGAHGVAQFRALSVPLVVLSVGGLVVLVTTSRRFTRSSHLDATQVGALLSIVGVFCYGTAGAYALRSGFDGVESIVDAVYFTVVTASTVGYGDVHASTDAARLFAVSLVVLGPATIAATAGSLFGPAVEAHLARTGRRATGRRARAAGEEIGDEIDAESRIVVLGAGETIRPAIAALAGRASVTVVTGEASAVTLPDGIEAIIGEPTAERTLERAGLETCDAVLVGGGEDDQRQLMAVARSVTDARIVAIVDGEALDALERAGADAVVDPEAVLAAATVDALRDTDESVGQSSASAASQSG